MDRAHHLGKPVARALRRLLLAACLAAATPAAIAQNAGETVSGAIRDVTPPRMTRLLFAPGTKLERLPALVLPPPPPKLPKRVSWPRAHALAAGRIASRGERIAIAGVRGLPAEAVCRSADGDWPCGNFARAAFARLLRERSVECDPAMGGADGEIVTACSVGGRDIGRWLVALGWAEAAGTQYRAAMDAARAAGLGKWGEGPPAF